MQTEKDILENLIGLTQDSVNGYREAAQLVQKEDTDLAKLFEERSRKREQILSQLRTRLRTLDPDNKNLGSDGTISGQLHQYFMQFRSLFQSDRKAALAEVDRGESTLEEAYQDAEKNAGPEFRPLLQGCLDSIHKDAKSVESMYNAA